jgi:formamidase
MFPEMAREAAYREANVILCTARYPDQVRRAWRITNRANALANLAFTASAALAGPDEAGLWCLGEAMICDPEGRVLVRGDRTPGRIVTTDVVPERADAMCRTRGPENNNIYQLGHRGDVAVSAGARSAHDYRYVRDLAEGRYRVPWEDEVEVTDGTAFGFPPPRP